VLALALLFLFLCLPGLLLLFEFGTSFVKVGLGFLGSLSEGVELGLVRLYVFLDVGKLCLGFFQLFLIASGAYGLGVKSVSRLCKE
jgi:hypothetical protein